jgi:hypothetical protein
MSNVVYLKPPKWVEGYLYAQVSEVVDGKAVSLIGEGNIAIPVLGMSGDLPTLASGDWVNMLGSRLGAHVLTRIEIDREYSVGRCGLEPGRWYELFSSPKALSVSINAVRGGWIMCIGDGKYRRLNAKTVTLKYQDGRLMHLEKSSEAFKFSVSNGQSREIAIGCWFTTCSLSIRLGDR